MLAEMQLLVRAHTLCVLATSAGDKPYCSLMAYVANESGTEIYLATHRTTRKFRNLTTNPAVSLMIDTRQEAPRTQVRALTVEGACAPVINEARKDQVRAHFLAVHSHLKEFLGHDDCELLCVTVTSFLLLNGLTEAHYATLA